MRRLRIAALLICALFSVLATPHRAAAQDAETMQAANDLMAVMSPDTVRQMVTGMTNQVWPTIERQVRGKRPDVDQVYIPGLRGTTSHALQIVRQKRVGSDGFGS